MPACLADTICALSTARGRAGIAVVRLSGPGSLDLVRRIFVSRGGSMEAPEARKALLGSLLEEEGGREIDQAIVTWFPGPGSYTGEDVVEISLHGSPVVVAHLLDWLCSHGARPAEPGEFTLRAFLRGRMDLVQAEAVRDLIEATTLYQARVASRQRAGELSHRLAPLKDALVEVVARMETALEFSEEGIEAGSGATLAARLSEVRDGLRRWIGSYRQGRLVRDGFGMAIVGLPNVGKSSLFNALLEEERSIVTDIPGTTRDLVSEFTSMGGIPVRLVDTAGVNEVAEGIEKLGVDRSLRAMADADVALLVVDGSRPRSLADDRLRERLEEFPFIVAVNKTDLAPAWSQEEKASFAGSRPCIEVSARTGRGLDRLRAEIMRHLTGSAMPEQDGLMITNLRQCRCLEEAARRLERALETMRAGLSEEFALVDLRAALDELGAVTGETSTEDILGEIFSRFCIGK